MSLEEIKSGLDDLLSEKDNLRLDLTSKQAELLERSQSAGQLTPILGMTPAQAAFNWAILPGWQRWKPLYLVGEITAIDSENDTVDITFDDARSVAQNLPVAYWETYPAIPVKYMECNSAAFAVGDRVVVEFANQDLEEPKVIGFETEPKECPPMVFYRVQLRYVDDDIVKVADLNTIAIEEFSTFVDEEEYVWERIVDDTGFMIRVNLFSHHTNTNTVLDSWGNSTHILKFSADNIQIFIAEMFQKGLVDHIMAEDGSVRFMGYNMNDERLYMFLFKDEYVEDRSLDKHANLGVIYYSDNHPKIPWPWGYFSEDIMFAPQQSKMVEGDNVKYNDRWYGYYSRYTGDYGNPTLSDADQVIYPGDIAGDPSEEYIIYIPIIFQYKTEQWAYHEVYDLDDIANCDGKATVLAPVYHELEQLPASHRIAFGTWFYASRGALPASCLGKNSDVPFNPDTWLDSSWQRGIEYSLNHRVTPSTPNGYYYLCISGGTSGTSEPAWNTGLSGTTVDGGVTWLTMQDLSHTITVSAHGEVIHEASESGLHKLTEDALKSVEIMHGGGHRDLKIEFVIEVEDPGYLYARQGDSTGTWYCLVTDFDCNKNQEKGGLARFHIHSGHLGHFSYPVGSLIKF